MDKLLEHIERVAEDRPGRRWRDVGNALCAVNLFVTLPVAIKVWSALRREALLDAAQWVGTGVILLLPSVILLLAYGLWRAGRNRKPPANYRPPMDG